MRTRTRNISLSRSLCVSTVFGVNCAWVATNDTLAGIGDGRIGVEHDARVGADLHPARLRGRQIDVHVDIGGVEHREDLAAGRQHLADIGDAVFDAAVARRDQRVVGDIDADRARRRGWPRRARARLRSPGPAAACSAALAPSSCCWRWSSTSLVWKPFCTRAAARSSSCCASSTWLFCCATLALASSRRAAPADLGLRFFQRGGEILRVHARDDLAGLHHIAFVGQDFGDAAGEFGVDVDLVGLEPAVAEGDAGRQLPLKVVPPIISAAGAAGDERQGHDDPQPPSACRPRLRDRNRQAGTASRRPEIELLRCRRRVNFIGNRPCRTRYFAVLFHIRPSLMPRHI